MSGRAPRDGTAEPVSRDQIKTFYLLSWPRAGLGTMPVDAHSAIIRDDHK